MIKEEFHGEEKNSFPLVHVKQISILFLTLRTEKRGSMTDWIKDVHVEVCIKSSAIPVREKNCDRRRSLKGTETCMIQSGAFCKGG